MSVHGEPPQRPQEARNGDPKGSGAEGVSMASVLNEVVRRYHHDPTLRARAHMAANVVAMSGSSDALITAAVAMLLAEREWPG